MIILLLIIASIHTQAAKPIFSIDPTCYISGELLSLKCESPDTLQSIEFKKNGIVQGSCLPPFPCGSGVSGYTTPRQEGVVIIMEITEYNETRDHGQWTCTYNGNNSDPHQIQETPCPTSPNSEGCLWIVIVVCNLVTMLIIIITVCCSNKNCRTHQKCWCCKKNCYTYCPVTTNENSEDWESYCYCKRICCLCNQCNILCRCTFMCARKCLKEYPALRSVEQGEPSTEPIEKDKKNQEASHIRTYENTNHSEDNPLSERKLPSIDNRVHNSQIDDTFTERPVLPPITQ